MYREHQKIAGKKHRQKGYLDNVQNVKLCAVSEAKVKNQTKKKKPLPIHIVFLWFLNVIVEIFNVLKEGPIVFQAASCVDVSGSCTRSE